MAIEMSNYKPHMANRMSDCKPTSVTHNAVALLSLQAIHHMIRSSYYEILYFAYHVTLQPLEVEEKGYNAHITMT